MSYYSVTSKPGNRHIDASDLVVLAVDDKTGEPTKVVEVNGKSAELNESDRKVLEGLGFVVESSSKPKEDDNVNEQEVDRNVAASAPLLSDQNRTSGTNK